MVVAVDEASAAVDPWRERTCRDKPSHGIPAHVTLVFPFVPAAELDQGVLAELRAVARGCGGFSFELCDLGRFPGFLYLAPAPAEPFVRLTEAIVERFPAHPPYGGAFDEIVPHLTVAQGDPALMDRAAASLRPLLPIRSEAKHVLLLEEVEPEHGRWRSRDRLPLGSARGGA